MSAIVNSTNFVIKRSKWLRGIDSALLHTKSNKMCCLGFYSLACGFKEKDIRDIGDPRDLSDRDKFPAWIGKDENRIILRIIRENDYCTALISDSSREENLIKLFAEQGVTVTFEN